MSKTDSVELPEYDGEVSVDGRSIIFHGPHLRGDLFTNGNEINWIYDGEVWVCNQYEPERYRELAREFGYET